MATNFLANAVLFVATSWAAAPPTCPAGTTLHATLNTPRIWHAEYCVDLLGRKSGPGRLIRGSIVVDEGSYANDQLDGAWSSYSDEGKSQYVTFYANGVEISSQMTLDGLRDTFQKVNIERRRAHKPSVIDVIDEHTLECRFSVSRPVADGVLATTAMDLMSETLSSSRDFCALFSTPMTHFENIRIALVDSESRPLGTTVVNRKDCPK